MARVVVVCLATLVGAVGLGAEARAQDEARWAVGAGAAVFSSPFKGADDIVVPVPYFGYEGDRLSIGPFNGSYRTASTSGVTVSAITMLRFQLTDPEDSPFLEGMSKRRATVEGGMAADLKAGPGAFRLEAQADLLGKHGGGQVSLGYGVGFPIGRLEVMSRAAVSWQSAELVDYYYGVRASEATAARPAYKAGDALVPSIGVDFSYPITRRTSLVAFTYAEFLPEAVTNSPIVSDKVAGQIIIGAIHRF